MLNIDMSLETLMRVGTISVGIYDYVRTLPAEYNFWTEKGPSQLRLNLILFLLIRYVSIITMIVSNIGYFSHSFTDASCHSYYMVAVVFKVLQIMVCQTILALRTYSIARKDRTVGIILAVSFSICTLLEWFTNLYGRIPIHNNGSCTSGNDPSKLINWTFYIWAMFFDMLTLGLSTYYLMHGSVGLRGMTGLVKMMVMDGVGYIAVLTAVNILNLILYRASKPDAQAAGATLGFAFTWIMSQNMLIKIRAAANTSRKVTHVSSSGGRARTEFGNATAALKDRGIEMDVQVKIERAVDVESTGSPWDESAPSHGQKTAITFQDV